MKRYGIDKLNQKERKVLEIYLENHAADSDTPEFAGDIQMKYTKILILLSIGIAGLNAQTIDKNLENYIKLTVLAKKSLSF